MEDNKELREKADLFDIVSDLHIDQWDSSLSGQYPCGKSKRCTLSISKIR